MSKYFLQYWKPEQADYNLTYKDGILHHTASGQLYRASKDDFIWIVTIRPEGQLTLIGKMRVDRITNQSEANRLYGTKVYKSRYHAIAIKGTEEPLYEMDISDLAAKLRFISPTKKDRFTVINRRVDGKQLQAMRELTQESAALLEERWREREEMERIAWETVKNRNASSMRHFVQYHNTELMGYACDEGDDNLFAIVTNKSTSDLEGHTVWLISGEGRPRKYALCEVFIVDEVGETDATSDFKFYAEGEGTAFRPPISLNHLSWFKQFLADYQNFSLGLREIKEEAYIRELEKLRGQLEPSSEAIENEMTSGAGFGNPETNRRVERAAVSYVTDWYEAKRWHVVSVEANKWGYDLLCKKGSIEEHVEVKGIQGSQPSFIITAGEVRQAQTNPLFVICAVTSALSNNRQMVRYVGEDFIRKFEITPLAYRATLRT